MTDIGQRPAPGTLSDPTPGTDTTDADGVLLRVRDLRTWFGQSGGLLGGGGAHVKAVNDVSFDLRQGDIFGLVGESGSGKTTLGRAILGLAPITGGDVWWRGRNLADMSERQLRPLRRQMGMVFQDPNASLNPAMTIVQGVGHPLKIHGIASDRKEIRRRVAEMLERCGLTPAERYLDTYPEDVSGGQKQRVVIARTLITEPELVVADEPVAALDMSIRAKVLELMLDLKDQLGLTYLYITHDLTSGRFVCDQIGIMYLGELVEWGDAAAIYDDPQHPYTDALLGAVPLPDPSRKGREKNLPVGEIPDALNPPAGCQFHPRCPRGFEPCGWEGADLVDFFERRWTEVGVDTFDAELEATGPLTDVDVDRYTARFRSGDAKALLPLIEDLRRSEQHRIFTGVADVSTADGGDVIVRFGEGPAPALQPVAGRMVACHLHGVVRRDEEQAASTSRRAAEAAGQRRETAPTMVSWIVAALAVLGFVLSLTSVTEGPDSCSYTDFAALGIGVVLAAVAGSALGKLRSSDRRQVRSLSRTDIAVAAVGLVIAVVHILRGLGMLFPPC